MDDVVTVEQTAARQWVVYINGDALQDYYTHGQANHAANLVRAALRAERAAGRAEAAVPAPPAPPPRDGIHVVQLHPTAGMCEHCGATREVLAFSLGGFRVQLCEGCLREFAETRRAQP